MERWWKMTQEEINKQIRINIIRFKKKEIAELEEKLLIAKYELEEVEKGILIRKI